MRKWRIEDSAELYNIKGWGLKYFSINDKGHVAVTPREGSASVDLKELMDELQVRDVTSPVLLRFPDILDNRIEKISKCFQQAADEYGYTAKNFIIYPIKVNQMRQVVEEIVSHGKKFNIGLEAGSKPELHAVLAINTDENSLIICNGYKDENYVELALLAQKMGRRIFLVVEKLNELRLIADISKRLKIRPNIGIRIKLASSGSGKWEESGGDGSKFGLNSSELLEALDFLEKAKMTDTLPHRQPNHKNTTHQKCTQRSLAILCPAPKHGIPCRVCRYRRRLGCRLRRNPFLIEREQHELFYTGVCQRLRLGVGRCLR